MRDNNLSVFDVENPTTDCLGKKDGTDCYNPCRGPQPPCGPGRCMNGQCDTSRNHTQSGM